MPSTSEMVPLTLDTDQESAAESLRRDTASIFRVLGPSAPWERTTYAALLTLALLWAAHLYVTWGAWGNLTVDSGREMYVPAELAQGRVLYRDVWFLYGPAAPYFNSLLFRLFGVHLAVLYWAGALSALGSAIFLYLTGLRLSSRLLGWTAGAVVLIEAFQPSLFCFPLPYSFAAVYGCLVACLFLWLAINALSSTGWGWMFAAGIAAATALLLKLEFGMACYAAAILLIGLRAFLQRSWRSVARDGAAILPGVAICTLVILWMVSIAGVEFITQENIMSWPTSYFMKMFGKAWLEHNGFTISIPAFRDALIRSIPVAGIGLALRSILWRKRSDRRAILLGLSLVLIVIMYFVGNHYFQFPWPVTAQLILSVIFFPRDMVLYMALACVVAVWYFWRHRDAFSDGDAAILLLLTFSSLLAFRVLMEMTPSGYAIYYDGPVLLSFLVLASRIIPRSGRSRRFVLVGELAICLACLAVAALRVTPYEVAAKNLVPLVTERGTVRVMPRMAASYERAIQFMKEQASRGQSVLSVPQDTSLYFLSGTECPTRVFTFDFGGLNPGKMTDEAIEQIDRKPVQYVLWWSVGTYDKYGEPVFGVDFDRELGDYLKSHYRPVRFLMTTPPSSGDWAAVIWERKRDAEISDSDSVVSRDK